MTDNMAEDIANNLFDMENEMTGFTMYDFNAVAAKLQELVTAGHVTKEVAHSMVAVYLGSLAKEEIVTAVEHAVRTKDEVLESTVPRDYASEDEELRAAQIERDARVGL